VSARSSAGTPPTTGALLSKASKKPSSNTVSGVCHTCITPLLPGDLTYTPDPLEPPGDGQVLICCAQPGTDIVLDM